MFAIVGVNIPTITINAKMASGNVLTATNMWANQNTVQRTVKRNQLNKNQRKEPEPIRIKGAPGSFR